MSILQYAILFLAPFSGGILAVILKTVKPEQVKFILSLSGAYLFGITVLHLIPEVYHGHDHSTGIAVLIGFFLQLLLEQFSRGLEHGHMHAHENAGLKFVSAIMFGLCMHAFLEGLPLSSMAWEQDVKTSMVYGIALHKVPAAFALVSVLLISGRTTPFSIIMLIVFASMSPFSALLGGNLSQLADSEVMHFIMAVVIGSFLHISTTILFESSTKAHKFSLNKKTI